MAFNNSYTNTTTVSHLEYADINGTQVNGNFSDEYCNYRIYSFIVYSIFVGSICILGLVGNVLSFVVFSIDTLKTSTSFLFQSLSVIDSLFLIFTFPMYAIRTFVEFTGYFDGYYHYVDPFILVYGLPIVYALQTSTIWTTVLVGVNRYIAVCEPYQASRLCTVRQAKWQLLVVVLFSVLYNVVKFFESCVVSNKFEGKTVFDAQHTWLGKNHIYHIIYSNICYMIFLLILPLIILTVLNVYLILRLNVLKRRRAEMQTMRQREDNNVTLVLIIVVVIFSICQTPALINQIMWNVFSDEYRRCGGFQFFWSRLSNMLVIINSAVNFPIYYSFNNRFRQILKESLCVRKKLKDIRNSQIDKTERSTNETLL